MCHSEWFSKLKSHTYACRVVHTTLLETEHLLISLEFVFLSFASILYITLLFIIFEGKGIWKSIENHHFVRYLLVNQQCTCNNDKKQFNTLCDYKQAATLIRFNHKCLCCCPKRWLPSVCYD